MHQAYHPVNVVAMVVNDHIHLQLVSPLVGDAFRGTISNTVKWQIFPVARCFLFVGGVLLHLSDAL